jgi:hypothetical protein
MGFLKKIISKLTGRNNSPEGPVGNRGDKDAAANKSGMILFEYDYHGSIGADSHSYKLEMADGNCVFSFWGMQYEAYGDLSNRVDASVFDRLAGLCEQNGVEKWNGFSMSDPYVCDGDGFSLQIGYSDGGKINAGGTNAYPENYGNFINGMREILDPLRDELLETGRQKIIKKGIEGAFTGGMFNFIQKGTAGSDSYFAMLFKQKERRYNCEIRIKTKEYRELPDKELRICKEVPDGYLHLDEIDALVKKYNLIEWYDYDKAAKDYNNAEWFQVEFCYEGTYINACGTEHPANYDRFRKDFLKILSRIVTEVKDL